MAISDCTFQNVTLSAGNGSAISHRIGDGFSFVVKDTTFNHCSAMYGGALYLVISADPSLIQMNGIDYISGGNSATMAGSTLFILIKGYDNLNADQFSSFITADDTQNEEAKVQLSTGAILTIAELLGENGSNASSESGDVEEEKNQYLVCVWIDQGAEGSGKVVVEVVNEGEELSSVCHITMEEGDIEANVGTVEKNGEAIAFPMGNEFTKLLQQCETFDIALNISRSLYDG